MTTIQNISQEKADDIIENWDNPERRDELFGSYLLENADGIYVAIENSPYGDCLVEDFKSRDLAERWLNGEFEVSELIAIELENNNRGNESMKEEESLKPVDGVDGWVDTDSGTQFVKTISETIFEVYDEQELPIDEKAVLVYKGEIDISDYTDSELDEMVSAYYRDLKTVKEEYPIGWQQVTAEIIAEQSDHDKYVIIKKEEA